MPEECRLSSKSKQIPWDQSSWRDRGTVFNIKGNGIHLLYFPLFCSEIWETLWVCSLGILKNKLFLAPQTSFSLWKSDSTLPGTSQKKIKAFSSGNIQIASFPRSALVAVDLQAHCGGVGSYPAIARQMTSLFFSIKSCSICAACWAKHTYVVTADEICMRCGPRPISSLKGNSNAI